MYLVYSKIGYNISHVILLQSKSEPYTMNTMDFQTIQLLQSPVFIQESLRCVYSP